jgi:hypothetical protein
MTQPRFLKRWSKQYKQLVKQHTTADFKHLAALYDRAMAECPNDDKRMEAHWLFTVSLMQAIYNTGTTEFKWQFLPRLQVYTEYGQNMWGYKVEEHQITTPTGEIIMKWTDT